MRHVIMIFFATATVFFLAACSDEERANPEDTLQNYAAAWQSFAFDEMVTLLDEESQQELAGQDWLLSERMSKIYDDLGVDEIEVSFVTLDFKEEEIDLDEEDELVYPVSVSMATIAGDLKYETDVVLKKQLESESSEEEAEKWEVVWHPSHIFLGLEEITDTIGITTEEPTRGEIFDRNGEGLAVNGKVISVGFQPDRIEDFEKSTQEVAEILDMDVETVKEKANQYPNNPDWFAEVQQLPLNDPRSEQILKVQGVWTKEIDGREYPYGEALGHLIGNIGQITGEMLEERQGQGYHANSLIGIRGLENELEDRLRGKTGITISVKDAEGNTKHVVLKTEAESGEGIHLTIDANLQSELAASLGEEAAAGVVMNPTTGEVLALVSQPSYDSNYRYLNIKDRLADEVKEMDVLYERRFQNAYAPGSIFKPFTAAIGLEEGTLDSDEILKINGRQWQPDSNWGSHTVTRVNDNSEVDLLTAMTYSDNIYFAQQALRIGSDTMEKWAETLGFGEPLPFAFPLYASTIANDGIDSDVLLADTGYGQGEVLTTPVHISALYTMFVNNGDIIQPRLFADEKTGEVWKTSVISPETVSTVLDSIIAVVEDPNGTAHRSSPGYTRSIAGKTGTAELKQSRAEEDGEETGWYVALDYDQKDLLVTVMIQDVGGRGGSGLVVDKVNDFLSKIE